MQVVPRADETDSGVPIGELARALGARLLGPGAARVTGVRQDSRAVEPGELFVALRGARVDGAAYARAAEAAGAVAVLCERDRAAQVRAVCALPVLEVEVARTAMAHAAAAVYGRPTERLDVVGVTGTNGKTTTAHLVQAAIDGAGGRAGIVGTLGARFRDLSLSGVHTSPEADELHRTAAAMAARGASHLVMEVSSIALAAERVAGVRFAVGAFTNLTQDHLDWHGSMEAYGAAKDRLFLEHRPAAAVVNVDDAHGERLCARILAEAPGTRLLRFSARATAEVTARGVRMDARGITFDADTPRGRARIASPLLGEHNVQNLLCALAISEALGLELAGAVAGMVAAPPVPGRLERCDDPARDDVVGIVDYAHTPDALGRVLASVRPLVGPGARLWCVFGCGGDRDPLKRGPMGEMVGRLADAAIVTNDNPRSEDPRAIADAVARGLGRAAGARFEVELDRARAIGLAVERARPGDVVLVAGKGHEPYQIIGERVASFDDRVELRAALARRRGD
jgi:UDP-N-acetylmuramoyl-L-alanyl-D-glutamate--2,6-diaminopimelate ligase